MRLCETTTKLILHFTHNWPMFTKHSLYTLLKVRKKNWIRHLFVFRWMLNQNTCLKNGHVYLMNRFSVYIIWMVEICRIWFVCWFCFCLFYYVLWISLLTAHIKKCQTLQSMPVKFVITDFKICLHKSSSITIFNLDLFPLFMCSCV